MHYFFKKPCTLYKNFKSGGVFYLFSELLRHAGYFFRDSDTLFYYTFNLI